MLILHDNLKQFFSREICPVLELAAIIIAFTVAHEVMTVDLLTWMSCMKHIMQTENREPGGQTI